MFSAAKTIEVGDQMVRFEPLATPDWLPQNKADLQALLEQNNEQLIAQFKVVIDQQIARTNEQIAQANEQIAQANEQIARADVKAQLKAQAIIEQYLEQVRLERHRLFGVRSEQMPDQARLFDEAEQQVALALPTDPIEWAVQLPAPTVPLTDKTPAKKPSRGKRAPLPADLPRVQVVHDLPEGQRLCPCGTPMIVIGQEVSEQLDIVPMQIRVLQHVRLRYGCPDTGHTKATDLPVAPLLAPMPLQPIPKSNASVNVLAQLLTVKYVDGLPLARFEKVLERHGVRVPRNTLARWVIACGHLLQPLFNLARDTLHEGAVIHMDETPIQVLKGSKGPTSDNYMWVQTGGPPGKAVTLYDYDASRSGQVPLRLLAGWQGGYLMTDGYAGYNAIGELDEIILLACMAHVRRKFVEALVVQPKQAKTQSKKQTQKTNSPSTLAEQAIAMIGQLYAIEKQYKDASNIERQKARHLQSIPILNTLHAWLQTNRANVPPQMALGKAMTYLANCWPRLIRYTELGDLPIDNNWCENAIRPFVMGRKAWLFSDTASGANASAIIYSMIQTAKANGQEPSTWLRHVLQALPTAKTVDDYDALMPWNVQFLPKTTIAN